MYSIKIIHVPRIQFIWVFEINDSELENQLRVRRRCRSEYDLAALYVNLSLQTFFRGFFRRNMMQLEKNMPLVCKLIVSFVTIFVYIQK